MSVLLTLTSPLYAQCTREAQTQIVYVKFVGCDPGDTANVIVGGEHVTVKKLPNRNRVWRGETSDTFTLKERSLTVDDIEIPNIRFACSTKAVPSDEGECVAVYRVECETLWYLHVAKIPATAKATITFVRNPIETSIKPCADVPKPQPGQEEIELAQTQSVLVQVDKPKVEIPIDIRLFKRFGELTLKDVSPSAATEFAPMGPNPAQQEVSRRRLAQILTGMTFTKKDR